MIIYIHGFGSSGKSAKTSAFREYFKIEGEDFISPSLSYVPELAIQTLEELISSFDEVKLIGSSLGGFYCMYLAEKYNLKAVVINPSIFPYKTLNNCLNKATNFYDGSFFEWNEKHVKMLKKYKVELTNQKNYLLLVQKGDELLDYKEAVDKLQDSHVFVEEGGSHGFDGIERHFENVKEFFEESKI